VFVLIVVVVVVVVIVGGGMRGFEGGGEGKGGSLQRSAVPRLSEDVPSPLPQRYQPNQTIHRRTHARACDVDRGREWRQRRVRTGLQRGASPDFAW